MFNKVNSKKQKSKITLSNKLVSRFCGVLAFLLISVIISGCAYIDALDADAKIMENVFVAGVNVGGMTRDEAANAVTNATANTYTATTMKVSVFDTVVEISPEISTAELNVDSAVWEAFKCGRRLSSDKNEEDKAQANNGGIIVDLSGKLNLDKDAIQLALAEFGNHYNTTLTQSTWEVTGTAPELTLVVNLGVPEYGLNLDKIFDQVMDAYSRNVFTVEGECELLAPDNIDLKSILKKYSVEPVDAKYDQKTFDVIPGSNGCSFDVETVQKKLDESKYGTTVKIPFDIIEPEKTAEYLQSLLYKDQLATYTAFQSSSSSRATNLRLACEAVNGTILMPGDVFSYNETLGERTVEKGYGYGAAYSGGEVISSIGGGICQVSSTLYYCCLLSDLEIVERENHSYASGYLPLGMDATVSWGYIDYKFRNNTDYPIRIEAIADGGSTTIALYGTDTKSYYVDMEYVVTGSYGYETKYEILPPDNPDGYKDGEYIVSPCVGYDVVTYRCKYDKATNALISRDYEATSKFIKRDAVICKIQTDAKTPPDGTSQDPNAGIGNGGVTDQGGELPSA